MSRLPTINSNFLSVALDQGVRLDNRGFENYRDIEIKRLAENGQVLVSIGRTSVLCSIFSSVVTPQSDKPSEGIIVFSIDTSHLKHEAESKNANEELNEMRTRLSNLLEKSLKDSR